MTEVLYIRKKHIIHAADGSGVVFTGTCNRGLRDGTQVPSINAAKRASRKLQQKYGQGCVRVDS